MIANPIYDVIFKYMMEDNAVAKLVVSSIIGEQVVELEPKPQEYTTEKREKKRIKDPLTGEEKDITVYRLDFAAKIKISNGYKLIIIEMQKASLPTDIVRFRSYLGEQFRRADNVITTPKGDFALPIYCLYFLGKGLGICKTPVIEVDSTVHDSARALSDSTKPTVIKKKSHFIDALHHRSWIIQIDCLKERRRNDVEILLGVFDQSYRTEDNHFLNIREEDFPEKYWPVIRRLKMAASNPTLRKLMQEADEWERYIKNCIRIEADKAEKAAKKIEKELKNERKKSKAKDADIKAKDADIKAKDEQIRTIIKNLAASGMNATQIAQCTNMSIEEVEKILQNLKNK